MFNGSFCSFLFLYEMGGGGVTKKSIDNQQPLSLINPSCLSITKQNKNNGTMASLFSRLTDRLDVDMESLLSGHGQEGQEEQQQRQRSTTSYAGDTDDGDETMNCCPSSCSICPSLTWQERLGGCAGCMILGYVLSFGSFFRLKDLMLGDPGPFVVYATIGNIISLSGSFFLSGPKSQLKKMFHESRKIATCLYLGSLGVTLIVAFISFGDGGGRSFKAMILVILLIFQYVAVAWYCMSYIPFARQMATRACNAIMSRFDD
jgi:hypothetical protein